MPLHEAVGILIRVILVQLIPLGNTAKTTLIIKQLLLLIAVSSEQNYHFDCIL